MPRPCAPFQGGFTLIELIAVLAIVAALAAFAVPRHVGSAAFESRGFFDRAQSIVRQAQKLAIAQRRSSPKTRIYAVISATEIRICYDASCTSTVADPASGAALSLPAPSSVSLSPVTVSFDGSGAPNAAATINVNSSAAGDVNRVFYVEAATGYVHK